MRYQRSVLPVEPSHSTASTALSRLFSVSTAVATFLPCYQRRIGHRIREPSANRANSLMLILCLALTTPTPSHVVPSFVLAARMPWFPVPVRPLLFRYPS